MKSNPFKIYSSPKTLLILTIFSIFAIAATIYLEYKARQEDYLRLLERQASLFINTVRYATENALAISTPAEEDEDAGIRWIGQFLKRFQADENIEYVVVQFGETIIAGSFKNYNETSLINDDVVMSVFWNQQTKHRILDFNGKLVHETLTPIYYDDFPLGVLRLGLSMEEYQALQKNIGGRLFILGVILIVFGLIFINLLISYRHRRLLYRDLGRLRDYTTTVFDNLSSGVIGVDENRMVRSVNKQALHYMEKDYASVFGNSIQSLPPDYAQAIFSHLNKNTDGPIISKKWQTINGSRRLLSLQTNVVRNDDGSKNCVLIFNDITEQSQLEEQIRRNQRLDAMKNLAFSVAHEIKNPLNAISLIIDLIRKKYKPAEDVEKYNKHLDTVSSEIVRISDIVEQYLKFSRPMKLNLGDVDVPDLMHDIHSLLAPQLQKDHVEFEIDLVAHKPLKADRDRLKQLFLNLIKNAHEAIKQNGHISVIGRIVDIFYQVRITDDGSGIPEKDVDAIFDLYFTSKAKGNGVGLSVAQQIVEAHGGTIEVESEEGVGTTFFVRLPL